MLLLLPVLAGPATAQEIRPTLDKIRPARREGGGDHDEVDGLL